MDLSEKRRQLEELRAARLKKQQLVDQLNTSAAAPAPASPANPTSTAAATGAAAPPPRAAAAVTKARPASPARAQAAAASSARAAPSTPTRSAAPSTTAAAPPAAVSVGPAKAPERATRAPSPHKASPPTPSAPTAVTAPAAPAAAAPVKTAEPVKRPLSPRAPTAHVAVTPERASTPTRPAAVAAPLPGAQKTATKPTIAVRAVQTDGAGQKPVVSPRGAPAEARKPVARQATASASPQTEGSRQISSATNITTTTGTATTAADKSDPPPARAVSTTFVPITTTAAAPSRTPTAPVSAVEGDGLSLFHRWGALPEGSMLVPQCVPVCALSSRILIGSKGRLVRSTAVTALPVQLSGTAPPQLAPCVIAAYAKPPFPSASAVAGGAGPQRERSPSASELVISAANSIGGLDHSSSGGGGGRLSPTTGASVAPALATVEEPELDMAVREAALTDAGYAWGTSATSRVHCFAGPSSHPTPGTSRSGAGARHGLTGAALKQSMRALAKNAPGLAVAWTVVALHELGDGSVADTLTVVTPLVCDSEITCLATDAMRPTTLYGGLRCGRVVCWNLHNDWAAQSAKQLRTKAVASSGSDSTYLLRPRRPTLSSFPSPLAHQGPVLHIGIHGDFNAPQLYTVSQEGKMCTWSALDPSMPTTSRSAYTGNRFLGSLASTAAFTTMRSTGAIMDVILGTSTGCVLRGTNRDNRVVELTPLWPPSSGKTGAGERSGGAGGVGGASIHSRSSPERSVRAESASSPLAASVGNPFASASFSIDSNRLASTERSGSSPGLLMQATTNGVMKTWGLGLGSATGGSTAPHLGIVTAVAVQPVALSAAAAGVQLTEHDTHADAHGTCVVSAATDGSCVAWVNQSVIPLSGFLSIVTCLQWSPTHTSLFAAGDAFGQVSLWNLYKSVTVPCAKVMLGGPLATTRSDDANAPIVPLHPGIKRGRRAADYLGQPLRGRIRGRDGAEGSNTEEEADVDDDATSDTTDSDAEASALENEEVMRTDFIAPGDGAVAVTSLTFSADGRWLFAANAGGMVYVLMLSKYLWR